MFLEVESTVKLPAMEERILQFWRDRGIFDKSLKARSSGPEFVFYEGPPTANGRPGVHHVQARAYKDLIPRYKSMQGFNVPRKAGWDCHGLPVELEVEKRLGFSGKPMIEQYGVGPFNRECRASVLEYEGAWRQMTERIAFWVDMDRAYMTLSNDYVESVWWSLAELWKKGLVYQGYKVLPYCPRCGTPLSSHEVGLGYEDITDPSIYIRFPLRHPEALGLGPKSSLLVWTTTPWTLFGNTAAAVNPTFTYVAVQRGEETLVLAQSLVEKVLKGAAPVVKTFSAQELLGAEYVPPYDIPADKKAWYVVPGAFVTAEDGTGIVHIAPAFGADDMEMSKQHGLPVLRTVDGEGHFPPDIPLVAGKFFRDGNAVVVEDLKTRGVLYRAEDYVHSYPHCWRCTTPLMYYATTSWFIRNSSLKEQLQEQNQKINWFPAHIRDGRFGDWLDNLVDWAISRSRYWGTPLPFWLCDGCDHREAIGSYAELARRSRTPLDVSNNFDPHRPFVDDVVFDCPTCPGTMRRVPEVLDCWYDSGSMPFAQIHYPFENQERFKQTFPADFICEGLDQTRGWFNSLHQLGVMLFGTQAYKNVICHGLVLDANGDKMSKSRGNVVNPWDVIGAQGADALRWYLYTSSPPEFNRRFSSELVGEASRGFLMTWWNTYSFFVMYARLDTPKLRNPLEPAAVEERPLMDRWMLARLHALIADVTDKLDQYNLTGAARALSDFVEELSNWYVRLNRRRYWKSEADSDKTSAYQTLYDCLVTLARLAAPFVPFVAEEVYRNLVCRPFPDAPESVHLTSWPRADERLIDRQLLQDTESTMKAVNLGRAARARSGVENRQPLPVALLRARSADERHSLVRFSHQIAEELNVKTVELLAQDAQLVDYTLKPNLKLVGKKYGKKVPGLKAALEHADARFVASEVANGRSVAIEVEGENLAMLPEEILVEAKSPEGYSVEEDGGMLVALDVRLTSELRNEGLARHLVRHIQNARKTANLNIADTIITTLEVEGALETAARTWQSYLTQETLSKELHFGTPPAGTFTADFTIDGNKGRLAIQRANGVRES